MYSPEKPYKIYSNKEWWSDKWDPFKYGRDFDFTRPFFDQFAELQKEVPRMALNGINNENSDYTNYSLGNKNSYLVFTADYNEDCMYGRFSVKNFHCMDFDMTEHSTECYETLDAKKCTKCFFCQKCAASSELYFCYDMRNCHNCIGCANLRNKEYHVFNKKVSKEEFEKTKVELNMGSYADLRASFEKCRLATLKFPRKLLENIKCDDCTGDYLQNSKNAKCCFDSHDLQDVKFATQIFDVTDSYDWDFVGAESELCYEMVSAAYKMQNCKFTMNAWEGCYNLQYCELCLNGKDLFGCIGMRGKHNCILNKQYTKDEFDTLVPKIIEHMTRTGEYGQFFPTTLSPFAYNESVAEEYFYMKKEDALARGLKWRDEENKSTKDGVTIDKLPDNIKDVKDDILNQAMICPTCGKNYKLISQELKFYKQMGLALPRECWKCRHMRRMAQKNPKILYPRECAKCHTPIMSTYGPEKPEIVYCEKCYLSEVE